MVRKVRLQSGVEGNVTFGHFIKEVNKLLEWIAPRHLFLDGCLGETAAPLPRSQVPARLQPLGARHGTRQALGAERSFPPCPTRPQAVGGSPGSRADLCHATCRGALGTGGVYSKGPPLSTCRSEGLAMRHTEENG